MTASAQPLADAIDAYFRGEGREMTAILVVAAAAVAATALLLAWQRDGFSRALFAVVLAGALLFGGTAIALLRRDPPHRAALQAALHGPGADAAVEAERARMAQVIAAYPTYRHVAIGLAALGLVAVLVTRNALVAGGAAGLALLFAAQMLVDHYSEARAAAYARILAEAGATPAPSSAAAPRPPG